MMNRHYRHVFRALVLLLPLIAWSIQGTSGDEAKPNPGGTVISSGMQDSATVEDAVIGVDVYECSGGDFTLRAAAGEMVVGECASADYGLTQGAAAALIEISCDCKPGDPDNDNATSLADAVYIINYVFKGGPAPTPYAVCSGDPNGDCAANLADAVYFINYVFKGGPAPIDCQTWQSACGSPSKE